MRKYLLYFVAFAFFAMAAKATKPLDLSKPLEEFKSMELVTSEEILIPSGREQKMLMEGLQPISKEKSKNLKCLLVTYNPWPCSLLIASGTTFQSKLSTSIS